MILCIDSGNTRLKWGVHDGMAWQASGALAQTDLLRIKAELPRNLPIQRAVIANVAGGSVADALRALLPLPAEMLHFVQSEGAAGGVNNGYRVPVQLGIDRWCALVGARALTASACIVVGVGTATTIDTLSGDGDFLGGFILPGLDMMRAALARNTAQLPYTDGQWQAYPQRTQDAIFSGCIEAQVGAIERAYARIAQQTGAQCLLFGGAAPVLVPHLGISVRVEERLVLEGLRVLGQLLGEPR